MRKVKKVTGWSIVRKDGSLLEHVYSRTRDFIDSIKIAGEKVVRVEIREVKKRKAVKRGKS